MNLFNQRYAYGLMQIILHWIMAFSVIGLWILGKYMTTLDHYHPWYNLLPWIHRSMGSLLGAVVMASIIQHFIDRRPVSFGPAWQQLLARSVHFLIYLLLTGSIVSGYLMSTADGHGLRVFDWFELPAPGLDIANLEDITGQWHYFLTWFLVFVLILHIAGALKHHFIDGDPTLIRMLGRHPAMEDNRHDNQTNTTDLQP